MRLLHEFSASEQICLLPLQHLLKQVRNDLVSSHYLSNRPATLNSFLATLATLKGKNLGLVVAFEQPWSLDWQLRMAQKNLQEINLIVFDNSRNESIRPEIRDICLKYNTPYLALPPNRTRHANRSHGLVMNWIYQNVVRAIEPGTFCFLDHDLIPVAPCGLPTELKSQPIYGLVNQSKFRFWSLWAGYCFFDYASVSTKPLNFLYDFSRDLDTGGRNWNPLYAYFEPQKLAFAKNESIEIRLDSIRDQRAVQVIDDCWIHIGGISYNNNLQNKFDFFDCLANALETGFPWEELRTR